MCENTENTFNATNSGFNNSFFLLSKETQIKIKKKVSSFSLYDMYWKNVHKFKEAFNPEETTMSANTIYDKLEDMLIDIEDQKLMKAEM